MPSTTWIEDKKKVEQIQKSKALLDWIRENRETFWGSVGIVAAVIAFVVFFSVNYAKSQNNAWRALFMAQQNYYAGNKDDAKKIIDELVKNYGRSSAVPFAHMLEGSMEFAVGNYEEAEKKYSLALKKGNNGLAPVIMYDIAKTYEARMDWNKTIELYGDIIKKYPGHYIAPEVYTNMAVAYARAGKQEESKSAFEKITMLYPDTEWAEQAKETLNPTPKEPEKDTKAAAKPKAKAK